MACDLHGAKRLSMAVAESLSAERRAQIAEQLGDRINRPSRFFTESADYALAESLQAWLLDLDQVGGGSLRELCVHRGTWHHQVKQADAAVLVARSLEQNDETRGDLSVARSELAAKVSQAIEWADANVSDDWTARLLFVPPLLTYALWFERGDEDRLYVVDSSTFTEAQEMSVDELVAAASVAAADWGPLEFELGDEA